MPEAAVEAAAEAEVVEAEAVEVDSQAVVPDCDHLSAE